MTKSEPGSSGAGGAVPDAIADLAPYDGSLYEKVDLTGLAAFTVRWLQNNSLATTFENIVVAAFRMFPGRFCLQGYAEYPDAARIGRTLMQLGPKYRNWARGSVQKGFVLTDSGLQKVQEVEDTLSGTARGPQRGGPPKRQLPRTMDLSEDVQDIINSALYRKWASGSLSEGTELELLDLLGAYAYTPPRALRDRATRLENAAAQVGSEDVVRFLRAVRKSFPRVFADT